MRRVLVFSGTTEGIYIANHLASKGVQVLVSVATEFGASVMEPREGIEVRVGSCGGAEGIAALLREKRFDAVVDATHPYAKRISEHVYQACDVTNTILIRVLREAGDVSHEGIIEVESIEEAVEYLKGKEGRILSTTGTNELDLYTTIPDYKERVVARVLSVEQSMMKALSLGFQGANLICAKGPFSEEENLAHLRSSGARWMVTKDSGTIGGFEDKVRAARRAGAKVVLVKRPEDGGVSMEEAILVLDDLFELDPDEPADNPVVSSKRRVCLVGIGMGPGDLTQRAADRVGSADLLIGAQRMLDSVDVAGRDVLVEYRSGEISDYLDRHPEYRDVVVLLSGDVGFYSGAKNLLETLDRDIYDVDCECGISSAVYLCSRIGTSWQDVYMTSAHGRSSNLVGLSRVHGKVFTLLSGEDTVHAMCRSLHDYGMDVKVTVGQCFGYEDERIVSGTPEELLGMSFGDLCVALIENDGPDRTNPIGIRDDEFLRGDAPMTKSEVRALSVAKLKLSDDSVVYDVGAGTGSVSIEMALCAVNGHVYAIEKEDVAADLIEENKKRFKTDNVTVVRGLAPEAMADLPTPTHAFIGGSSGNLRSIVACLLEKNPDVRIVINSVTLETVAETMQVIKDLDLREEDTVCINVSWARKLGRYHLMTAQNPIYISVVMGP